VSGLGRRAPTDWRHVERFPVTAAPAKPVHVPVVFGLNWYTGLDTPQRRGREWWLPGPDALGSIRGGHAICSLPEAARDSDGWWTFYNQGQTGACTGFSASRCMSILNRRRYDAVWLWRQARLTDEWTDNDDLDDLEQGSSVRAAFEVLRVRGHELVRRGRSEAPSRIEGISAYRWATSVDEVRAALGARPDRPGVPLLQSWGRSWPHVVWLPDETLERLLREDGEAGIPSDR
jgi:hypothetical protein